MEQVYSIIPARAGSKSIKDKNIRLMDGKPLLAYSIAHSLASTTVARTIVSTDSAVYRDIALEYGAETPFLRPTSIAQDSSADLEVFQHALLWFKKFEGKIPDILVHLRPTHPVRKDGDIDRMVTLLLQNPEIDAVRSITPARENPYKMWVLENNGHIAPVVKDIPDCYNMPRQSLPKPYYQNACIDVVRSTTILEKNSMTGKNILGYPMDYCFDIDEEQEFMQAEQWVKIDNAQKSGRKLVFCFDIDGIIASLVPDNNYAIATPLPENIQKINTLHKQGHKIILFTARGSATGLQWEDVTREQLHTWNILYDELLFGKPPADFYIDDRFISIFDLEKEENTCE